MSTQFFIFGVGYSGQAIAKAVLDAGGSVSGTTRSAEKVARLRASGVTPHLFDGELSAQTILSLEKTTHLLVSVAPGAADPVLGAARDIIANRMPALRWIGYLSTVGVYGDHDGGWVDEDSECRPVSRRSVERLEAEHQWQALGAESGRPVAVMRLSGIYGPGRNALVNLEQGTARRIIKSGQVFNRIHVEDIAGAALLLAKAERGGICNVSDDEPSPPQDVVSFAADLMGTDAPAAIAFDDAELSPMARSFYGENKRVSNAKVKGEGYSFRFPNYRSALAQMWADGSWRG